MDLWGLAMGTTRLRLTAYSVASLHDLDGHARAAPSASGPPSGDIPAADVGGPPGPAAADGKPPWVVPGDPARSGFRHLTTELVAFYGQIADQLAGPPSRELVPVAAPVLTGPALPQGVACGGSTPAQYQPDMLWVGEYLYHLGASAGAVTVPAAKVASLRRRPWWR